MEKMIWGKSLSVKERKIYETSGVEKVLWCQGSVKSGCLLGYDNELHLDFSKIPYNDITGDIIVKILSEGKFLEITGQEHLVNYVRSLEKLHERNSFYLEKRDSILDEWEAIDLLDSKNIGSSAIHESEHLKLNKREKKYVSFLLEGYQKKEIAELMNIGERTGRTVRKCAVSKIKRFCQEKGVHKAELIEILGSPDDEKFHGCQENYGELSSSDLSQLRYRKVYSTDYVRSSKLTKTGKLIEKSFASFVKDENERIRKGELRPFNHNYEVKVSCGNHIPESGAEKKKESGYLEGIAIRERNRSYTMAYQLRHIKRGYCEYIPE